MPFLVRAALYTSTKLVDASMSDDGTIVPQGAITARSQFARAILFRTSTGRDPDFHSRQVRHTWENAKKTQKSVAANSLLY